MVLYVSQHIMKSEARILELMKLVERIIHYYSFDWRGKLDKNQVNKDLEDTIQEYNKKVKYEFDTDVLTKVTKINWENLLMPIDSMFLTYQRLICITKDLNILRDFAEYLFLFRPDWEEEAKKIIYLIENNDIEQAIIIANQVDYDQYQKSE